MSTLNTLAPLQTASEPSQPQTLQQGPRPIERALREPDSATVARYRAMDYAERMDLALSATLAPEYRSCIIDDQHAQVKAYFSRRADLTPAEVAALLADPNQTVRLNCAKRNDLTPEQVEACVSDRDPNLRYFIARNPLLTDAQRRRLMTDEDELVRIAASKGPKIRGTRARPGQAEMIR